MRRTLKSRDCLGGPIVEPMERTSRTPAEQIKRMKSDQTAALAIGARARSVTEGNDLILDST